MKVVMMAAALGLALTAAPALAGGKSNGLNVGVGALVSTGKGGLLAPVLVSSKGGKTVVAADVKVSTGKGGLLGGLLGGGKSGGSHGGW